MKLAWKKRVLGGVALGLLLGGVSSGVGVKPVLAWDHPTYQVPAGIWYPLDLHEKESKIKTERAKKDYYKKKLEEHYELRRQWDARAEAKPAGRFLPLRRLFDQHVQQADLRRFEATYEVREADLRAKIDHHRTEKTRYKQEAAELRRTHHAFFRNIGISQYVSEVRANAQTYFSRKFKQVRSAIRSCFRGSHAV